MKPTDKKCVDVEYLIIGGGPAGLGAAWQLHNAGADWLLLEKQDGCGGLSRSFRDEEGFTWDYGGHVLFSHYETFDRYMVKALGEEGWLNHNRESWVWLCQRFVPYPFQRNLHRLDPEDRWRCVKGLLDCWKMAREEPRKVWASFHEWILGTFGAGIADLFLLPYNYKVWAWPSEQMDYAWIGERVAVPQLEGILHSICTGQDDVSWGPNNTFRFPKAGGTGAIWSSLANQLPQERIQCGAAVVAIDAWRHLVTTQQGQSFRYRKLISTMPLDDLAEIVGMGAELKEKVLFSGTHVVGVGIQGQPPDHLKTKCWMYFPESRSPYYRVTVFSNYSPNNVAHPEEQWSLMAEVSESYDKPVEKTLLKDDVVSAFIHDELLSHGDVIKSVACRYIPKAYPTPFLGRDAVIDPVLRLLEKQGIFSRGRFGAWKYEVANMDHSFMQGWECAHRLLKSGGADMEPTLHRPAYVNSRRNS